MNKKSPVGLLIFLILFFVIFDVYYQVADSNVPILESDWFRHRVFIIAAITLILLLYLFTRKIISKHKKQEMFSRKLMEEQEYSWRKTSAELHDSIGQNLLVINNKILQLVNNGTPEKTKTELRELSGFVSESIEEVRRISGNLYPHQLEKLGLTSSIESMLKKVSGVLGSKLQYKIEKIDGLLPKEYEIYFFRIIQEAVNNIIKHSGAKNAAVEIYTDQKYINTRIEDDGKGFDKNIFRSGLGLQNMRERASVLNGFIDVMSGPGKGTKIMVIIPYKKANHG